MRANWLLTVTMTVASLACWPSVARAQDTTALYEQGRAALADKRGPEARAAFEAGLAVATPGAERFRMLLGLALAHELLNDDVWALVHYRAFLIAASTHAAGAEPSWQPRRQRIQQEADALEAELATTHADVEIRSTPADATLTIDGRRLPKELRTPAHVRLTQGRHELAVSLGDRVVERQVTIDASRDRTIDLTLSPEPRPAPPTPSPAPSPTAQPLAEPQLRPVPAPPPPPEPAPAVTWTGVGIAAGGVVSVAASVALYALARNDASELDELQSAEPTLDNQLRDLDLRSQIASREAASTALGITGALMLVGGTLTVVLNETSGGDDDVALLVGPHRAGLRLRF